MRPGDVPLARLTDDYIGTYGRIVGPHPDDDPGRTPRLELYYHGGTLAGIHYAPDAVTVRLAHYWGEATHTHSTAGRWWRPVAIEPAPTQPSADHRNSRFD